MTVLTTPYGTLPYVGKSEERPRTPLHREIRHMAHMANPYGIALLCREASPPEPRKGQASRRGVASPALTRPDAPAGARHGRSSRFAA